MNKNLIFLLFLSIVSCLYSNSFADEVATNPTLKTENSGSDQAIIGNKEKSTSERLLTLEKVYGAPYGRWVDYYSAQYKFSSLSDEMEKSFAEEKSGTDIPVDEQWYVYRLCDGYFHYRKYDRLEKCLQRLEASLKKHGERGIEPEKWTMLGPKAPYLPYPLALEVLLIRGQVALDFGDPKAALRFFVEAQQLWASKYELLGNSLDGWRKSRFQFDLAMPQSYRLHYFLAIANYQVGNFEESRKYSTLFEKTIGPVLFGISKENHNGNLVALYLATGRPEKAIDLVSTWDPSNKAGRTFNALTTGFHPVFGVIGAAWALLSDPRTVNSKFQAATLLVSVGKYSDAKSGLEELLSDPLLQASSSLYWSALYDRGRVAESEGDHQSAINYYRRSIEEIEIQRSTINGEGARIGFFGDRQSPYRAIIRLLIQQGKYEEAFLMTERSKARALVDLLANKSTVSEGIGINQSAKTLLEQQKNLEDFLLRGVVPTANLLEQISATDLADPGQRDPKVLIKKIRSVQSETLKALERQSPELASLVAVTDVTLDAIRERMQKDESLVSYFYDQKDMYAFVVTKDQIALEKLDRMGLEKDVEAFREALQDSPDVARSIATRLFDRLVRPWVRNVSTQKLIVAPHGVLHYLPFNALVDGDAYLIDRFQISFLPSASTIRFIGKHKADGKVGSILALGNPDLGNPKYDLQFAEKEARSVSSIFPGSATLLRKEASKENLKKYASGFRYLHFASHGVFYAENPMGSALMLAGNSITDESHRLTVSELYSMRLNADLVTLSACQTGLGAVSSGDDVLGLLRGFLYAGANNVVSTLWEIDDEATEKLMVGFYRDLKMGKPKVSALRDAQIELRKQYPEPRFWAAFQITGN